MSNSILNKEERLVEVYNIVNQSEKQNEILSNKVRKFKKSHNLYKKSPTEKNMKNMKGCASNIESWIGSGNLMVKSYTDIVDGDKIINEISEDDSTLSSSDWSNITKINNVG
jgi:hypothetical protein